MLRRLIARRFATKSPLELFRERELLYQSTTQKLLDEGRFAEAIRSQNQGKCAAYCGYDPSNDSLHLGNLVSIIMMGRLAQLGIDPIFLVGGATGMIGDPSGKSKERKLLEEKEVNHNLQGISRDINTTYKNVIRLLKVNTSGSASTPDNYRIVNNADFYTGMNVITYLRDVGKNFRVNALLAKESVTKRIESTEGISYSEFSYGILQAHDFAVLNQQYGCVLQIGGSDQWGNITNGCDYVRRTAKKDTYAITMPLLLTATGEKFGKSEGNALFLNPEKTPISTIYQYLMSTPDSVVKRYLAILTCLSLETIEEVYNGHLLEPEKRVAQKLLCDQVCKILGESGFQNPHELFYKAGDLKTMPLATLESSASKLDSKDFFTVSKEDLGKHRDLIDLLHSVGLGKSKGELRREVDKGGVYLNNKKLHPEEAGSSLSELLTRELLHDRFLVLRFGKKHYKVIRLN